MKKILTLAAALTAFTLAASAAQAQNLTGQATAQSGSLSSAGAIAGNNLTLNSPSDTEAKIKAAPGLGGLALGSGHPCAYSPSTAQISIIGGGAGYGAMKVDSACMLLLQSVVASDRRAYMAAIYMIAARDEDACKAMEAAGMIKCGEPEKEPRVSTSGSAVKPKARPALYTKCVKDGGKVKIAYTSAGRKNKSVAKQSCLTSLGY